MSLEEMKLFTNTCQIFRKLMTKKFEVRHYGLYGKEFLPYEHHYYTKTVILPKYIRHYLILNDKFSDLILFSKTLQLPKKSGPVEFKIILFEDNQLRTQINGKKFHFKNKYYKHEIPFASEEIQSLIDNQNWTKEVKSMFWTVSGNLRIIFFLKDNLQLFVTLNPHARSFQFQKNSNFHELGTNSFVYILSKSAVKVSKFFQSKNGFLVWCINDFEIISKPKKKVLNLIKNETTEKIKIIYENSKTQLCSRKKFVMHNYDNKILLFLILLILVTIIFVEGNLKGIISIFGAIVAGYFTKEQLFLLKYQLKKQKQKKTYF